MWCGYASRLLEGLAAAGGEEEEEGAALMLGTCRETLKLLERRYAADVDAAVNAALAKAAKGRQVCRTATWHNRRLHRSRTEAKEVRAHCVLVVLVPDDDNLTLGF